ncbi:MAG: peptidoglycan editing factor PgeF [Acidimicrobiia bacterium]|nr:MAG: peptidoglycan editing factor PgeF [Acidimicrobiia bacterium]
MIRPRGLPGVVFGESSDGDPRSDGEARRRMSESLDIPESWAFVDQVHGSDIVVATEPGNFGEADGIITTAPMLPIAVTTADCVPLVLMGAKSVAVVHCGWRGLAAGIIGEAVGLMEREGDAVVSALVGPHIGSCCYEVGGDVVEAIGGHTRSTTSGTRSVDLSDAVRARLVGVDVTALDACTMHDERFHSFRENATSHRQVTVAWIPRDS